MHGINKDQKNIINRVRRISGQLVGIEKMILEDKYCIDIITQTSAIKSAISALEDEMLKDHLANCLVKNPKKSIEKLSEEILEVYKLKRK